MQTAIGYKFMVEIGEILNVMFTTFYRDKPITAKDLASKMRKEISSMLDEVNENLGTFFDSSDVTDIAVVCTNCDYTELYDTTYEDLFDDENDYPFEPVDNGFAFIWKD